MVSVRSIRRIGAASLILPSLDHLIAPTLTMIFAAGIMQTMFGPGAVAATIFFISLGLFQLVWIVVLLRAKRPLLLVLGVLGNLVSIIIYFISISGVTIFGVPPQPFSSYAILIKALETISVIASIYVLRVARKSTVELPKVAS